MYIDAHAHLDKYADDDVDAVLQTLARRRIFTLSVSVDVQSFQRTEEIAARSKWVVPAFGIHPSEASRYSASVSDLAPLVERSRCIGEIGLDHRFVTDERLFPAQREVFEWFLRRARDQRKLINVHCVGAEEQTMDLMATYDIDRAIIHWYSGPLHVLDAMVDAGFMFTLGVEVLESDHIREVARAVPTRQLLTETDNPGGRYWLTGEWGFPELIDDVAGAVAEVRGVGKQDLLESVRTNMIRLAAEDPHLEEWKAPLRP